MNKRMNEWDPSRRLTCSRIKHKRSFPRHGLTEHPRRGGVWLNLLGGDFLNDVPQLPRHLGLEDVKGLIDLNPVAWLFFFFCRALRGAQEEVRKKIFLNLLFLDKCQVYLSPQLTVGKSCQNLILLLTRRLFWNKQREKQAVALERNECHRGLSHMGSFPCAKCWLEPWWI